MLDHPGEVLLYDFLMPLGVSVEKLSKEAEIGYSYLISFIDCESDLTKDAAIRLSRYFDTSPLYWVALQIDYGKERS